MGLRAMRTPEGARAIIEHNIQVIYHLPNRYHYLDLALKTTRDDLLKFLNDIKTIEPIIWGQVGNKYVWYKSNKKLAKNVRRVGACSTCSRHFNYLCCLGVLVKLPQYQGHMIGINQEFILESGQTRAINVFTVHKYTAKELDKIEARAKLLIERKVTSGNLSKDKLVAAGLPDLAKEVFPLNQEESYDKKYKRFLAALRALETITNSKGYSTMSDLAKELKMSQNSVRELLRTFKLQLEEQFIYKAPTKQQKQDLNITTTKWIFTRR